jgi:hypothetical protein
MWGKVEGRDQIDVEGMLRLELEHDVGESPDVHFDAVSFVGYAMVLTKNAAKGTPREENGSGPLVSRDGRFLPKVKRRAGYAKRGVRAAPASLAGVAAGAASSRT